MELPQLGAGVHAQLAGDGVPGPAVDLERLRVPARAVQRAHQQQPQAFPQRVVRHQPAQLGHGLVVPAQGELGREPQFEGTEAELGQPFGLRFDQRRRRDVGQRTAVPQVQCLGQQPGRVLVVPGGVGPPAVPHHGLEQQRVGVLRGDPQRRSRGRG